MGVKQVSSPCRQSWLPRRAASTTCCRSSPRSASRWAWPPPPWWGPPSPRAPSWGTAWTRAGFIQDRMRWSFSQVIHIPFNNVPCGYERLYAGKGIILYAVWEIYLFLLSLRNLSSRSPVFHKLQIQGHVGGFKISSVHSNVFLRKGYYYLLRCLNIDCVKCSRWEPVCSIPPLPFIRIKKTLFSDTGWKQNKGTPPPVRRARLAHCIFQHLVVCSASACTDKIGF